MAHKAGSKEKPNILAIWGDDIGISNLSCSRERLIHAESAYPVSMTLIVAVLLLMIGLLAILSMVFHAGPFG